MTFKTQYKLVDSPFTHDLYIIKYRKWWCPFYLMYGSYEYSWSVALVEIKRLRNIEDMN